MGTTSHGYGYISINSVSYRVHRISYEIFNNKPLVYQGLHKCNNNSCFNPEHIYDGTQYQNMQDRKKNGKYLNPTHCKRGHPFDETNTYFNVKTNKRYCRKCKAIHQTVYNEVEKEAGIATV